MVKLKRKLINLELFCNVDSFDKFAGKNLNVSCTEFFHFCLTTTKEKIELLQSSVTLFCFKKANHFSPLQLPQRR